MLHDYGVQDESSQWLADGGAAFGDGPQVTYRQISHGAGGGPERIDDRVHRAAQLWEEAGRMVGSSR